MKGVYICFGCTVYPVFPCDQPPCIAICPGMDPDTCLIEPDDDRKPKWRPITREEWEEHRPD